MKIKILLTKGDPITVTEEQAKAILSSSELLFPITDEKGVWTGDVVHKSHIVQMSRDREAEREAQLKNPRIDDPNNKPLTEEQRELSKKLLQKFKPRSVDNPTYKKY